ncbi:MAG: IS5 family transposase [Legionellales bacterium]
MAKALKNRASKQAYISPRQMSIVGFDSPFSKNLNATNRWVTLAQKIPWDTLAKIYQMQMHNGSFGADGINPRVAIGAIIIKHLCDLSDRETIQQIQENMYMQYFIGYSSFSDEEPFDPSLFVDLRKRLGIEQINRINEEIMGIYNHRTTKEPDVSTERDKSNDNKQDDDGAIPHADTMAETKPTAQPLPNQGQLIVDATACPQDVSYPTDLNLLNDAREKSEEIIDKLCTFSRHSVKPRTYREVARKTYLKTAQKKHKSKKEIRSALRKQLAYLKRNIRSIYRLLDDIGSIPLDKHQYKYLLVIQTLYAQQQEMYKERKHSVEYRIVSIHQPHVRPIVRGKSNASVEFGAKIQVSLMNGIAFLDEFSWEAFNEGTTLMNSVEKYKQRFGYYPKSVLADKIYSNRENRAKLKLRHIELRAKPLGRPKKAVEAHVSPGERNPIEGKFGQAKTAYGLNRIKARLNQTSESWIASIILVLNLVKLAGQVPFYLLQLCADFFSKLHRFILDERSKKQYKNIFLYTATYSADPN